MSGENYIIIIDTNLLGSYKKGKSAHKNFKFLSVNKDIFSSLIKFLTDNSLTENFKIAIPEMVFEELKYQQIESYIAQLNKLRDRFKKFSELPGFELNIPDINYEAHLNEKIKAFVSKYEIISIDIPDANILPRLIERVLQKDKPFYKKENDKDSGFKDAIIWESILEYAQNNKNQEYLFLTKDPDFKDRRLTDEFLYKTGKEIKIIEDLSELKSFIDEKINLHLDFEFIRNSYNRDFREKLYALLNEKFPEIETDNSAFRIRDFYLGKKLFDINRMANGTYQLSIEFEVEHDTPYTGYGIIDEIYIPYETDESSGIIKLTIEKTEENELFLKEIDFENISLLGDTYVKKLKLS